MLSRSGDAMGLPVDPITGEAVILVGSTGYPARSSKPPPASGYTLDVSTQFGDIPTIVYAIPVPGATWYLRVDSPPVTLASGLPGLIVLVGTSIEAAWPRWSLGASIANLAPCLCRCRLSSSLRPSACWLRTAWSRASSSRSC